MKPSQSHLGTMGDEFVPPVFDGSRIRRMCIRSCARSNPKASRLCVGRAQADRHADGWQVCRDRDFFSSRHNGREPDVSARYHLKSLTVHFEHGFASLYE